MEAQHHQMKVGKKATMKRCRLCGRESEDTALICYGCGHKFSEYEDVPLLRKALKSFHRIIHGGWVGYLVVIPLSFIISQLTGFLLLLVFGGFYSFMSQDRAPHPVLLGVGFVCIDIFVGFSRVFFASRCLPLSKRLFRNRLFVSIILLILWLAYEYNLLIQYHPITVHQHWPLSESGSMILELSGGLAAVFLFYWEQRPKSGS